MNQIQKPQNSISPDLIVVGGGIFGLWAARHAIKRGERVLVLEKREIGAGASGGFLGALMPHMPDNWEAKKQLQFAALSSMPAAIARLEAETGIDCGYKRCGRLMPLTHEKMPENARRRIAGAKKNWTDEAGSQLFHFEVLESGLKGTAGEGWLNEKIAPYGATFDDLSARINPRQYVKALASYVTSDTHNLGEIRQGTEVVGVYAQSSGISVTIANGENISGSKVLIASGWEAYPFLGKMAASHRDRPITGRGVKGQAVLLDFVHGDDRPMIYDDGSYVIPHANGRVAVGSSSVDNWLPNGLDDSDIPVNSSAYSAIGIDADHPGRPASVEPAKNRENSNDDLLPEFTEMPALAKRAILTGNDLATESFAGGLTADDPLAQKLVSAARSRFDPQDMEFYERAVRLCPSIADAQILERWANVRPRNTVPHSLTGKISTEPLFGAIDGEKRIKVAIGGFKISLGLAHLDVLNEG
ncbi:MAG: FAD-dependent oxidoreductase [Salaquimonas sp.]